MKIVGINSGRYCDDCGCLKRDGICTNCHEELGILTFQGDCIDFQLSDEFLAKAEESSKQIKMEGKN